MTYKIAVGGQACRTHSDAELYIDKYARSETAMHRLESKKIRGIVLEDPTDEELYAQLAKIPKESEIHIHTSIQGRYSSFTVPRILDFLRRRRYSVSLRIEPIPESIREIGGIASISVSEMKGSSASPIPPTTTRGIASISASEMKGASRESRRGKSTLTSILFLAADPTDFSRLRLGEELREIQEKLQLAKLREGFELHQRMSVRPADISQALLDVQPAIVHFSGHGMATGALCFEDQTGRTHAVEPDALAALFEQFAAQVKCVVLNACYSEIQATAIAKHINYVVGMNKAIGDYAAIAFAIGFYQAIGAGRSIEDAYKLGCVLIRLHNIPEHLTPVLIRGGQLQA